MRYTHKIIIERLGTPTGHQTGYLYRALREIEIANQNLFLDIAFAEQERTPPKLKPEIPAEPLSKYDTWALIKELQGREGVEMSTIPPIGELTIKQAGPAIVLVVID